MASIYKRTEDGDKRKSCWYVAYTDENGDRHTKKGFTDKALTEQLKAKLEQEVMLKRRGLIDPAAERLAEKKRQPIDQHVEAYKKALTSKKSTLKHVGLTLSRVQKVIDGCGFETLGDIREDAVQDYLYELQIEEDLGNRTYNHYVQAFDGFCNFLVTKHRLAYNPVPGLVRLNAEVDVRHPRRALTPAEFEKLIHSARTSGEDIQCFNGEDRARIYTISFLTGLRRKEIASLTPRSFALNAEQPTITVQAASSKHRKKDVLPLHPDLISRLKEWLAPLRPDDHVFPKLAKRRTWLMVKKDLERVGIPYQTAEGIADFHAAGRHSFITGLLTNGATLPEAKELARHADVKMTMKYTHIGMGEQAKALRNLPFQERVRSASDGVARPPDAPAVTQGSGEEVPPETTNPGGCRGYVVLCLPVSQCDTERTEWRRRELNETPARRKGQSREGVGSSPKPSGAPQERHPSTGWHQLTLEDPRLVSVVERWLTLPDSVRDELEGAIREGLEAARSALQP